MAAAALAGRLRPALVLLLGALGGSCSATSPFASTPVAVILPGDQVLKGNASTRIGRGTFQASDGRVSCSGSFNPGLVSSDVSVFMACSNARRGVGLIKADDSDSGRATIRLEDRKGEALFVYGEAARRL